MTILVIDGQGGKLGKRLVESIKKSFPQVEVMAVGTNSAASESMMRAGADRVATGENPVIVASRTAQIIVGPMGIAIADGKTTATNISSDDRLALNRYLNSGKDNERMTADNAQEHRLNRAFQLLERVAEFCDKRQLVTVNRSLLSIAVDAADISRAVSSLDKRPAPGQPFSNSTGINGAGK